MPRILFRHLPHNLLYPKFSRLRAKSVLCWSTQQKKIIMQRMQKVLNITKTRQLTFGFLCRNIITIFCMRIIKHRPNVSSPRREYLHSDSAYICAIYFCRVCPCWHFYYPIETAVPNLDKSSVLRTGTGIKRQ